MTAPGAYLQRSTTDTVKGIFIAMIFITHIMGYYRGCGAPLAAWVNPLYNSTLAVLGQMVVVMFLFYSGYGVMCAIQAKGSAYVGAMPRKRVMGVLANFMVAVCIFYVVRLIFQIEPIPDAKTFALSLVCWDSVGNSNWYIFVILIAYILTYLSFKNSLSPAIQLTLLVVLSAAAVPLISMAKPYWWYDTIMAYPCGAVYAYFRPQIEKAASRLWSYLLMLAAAFALLIWTYRFGNQDPGLWHNIRSVAFALTLVLATMKLPISSKPLEWMGRNLFPLYIYQRLPMMVLQEPLCALNPTLYFAVCLAITFLLAYAYRFIEIKIPAYGRAVA